MNVFKIITPGPLTTVQDLGRSGYQRLGIPLSGALDGDAARMANLLVGNPADRAVLEMTLMGPRIEVVGRADIAVTGADLELRLNGQEMPAWCSVRVNSGDRLDIGGARAGCRAYLAVTGGIDVPPVMASRSTYIAGRIGGIQGRAIRAGDMVRRGAGLLNIKPLGVPQMWRPVHEHEIKLRIIPGPQNDFFDKGLETLLSNAYVVTSEADRMGYRLSGPPVASKPNMPPSIISEPSLPGGIQIPADRQPIILLVEQTVGGYAKIATVISADLPRLAQATPGDHVGFQVVDLETAHALFRQKQNQWTEVAAWFAAKTAPTCC